MTEINIAELADKTIADIKSGKLVIAGIADVKEAIKSASGIISKITKGAKAIGNLVYSTAKYIELLAQDAALSGGQKKELAVAIINRFLDLPWVPESSEEVIIGFALDVIIAAFNAHLGHAWVKKGGV